MLVFVKQRQSQSETQGRELSACGWGSVVGLGRQAAGFLAPSPQPTAADYLFLINSTSHQDLPKQRTMLTPSPTPAREHEILATVTMLLVMVAVNRLFMKFWF